MPSLTTAALLRYAQRHAGSEFVTLTQKKPFRLEIEDGAVVFRRPVANASSQSSIAMWRSLTSTPVYDLATIPRTSGVGRISSALWHHSSARRMRALGRRILSSPRKSRLPRSTRKSASCAVVEPPIFHWANPNPSASTAIGRSISVIRLSKHGSSRLPTAPANSAGMWRHSTTPTAIPS